MLPNGSAFQRRLEEPDAATNIIQKNPLRSLSARCKRLLDRASRRVDCRARYLYAGKPNEAKTCSNGFPRGPLLPGGGSLFVFGGDGCNPSRGSQMPRPGAVAGFHLQAYQIMKTVQATSIVAKKR